MPVVALKKFPGLTIVSMDHVGRRFTTDAADGTRLTREGAFTGNMIAENLSNAFEVLVVDDEPGARELLLEFFQSRGFAVTGAQDGRSAIATLSRSNGCFGLVVTDLSLPGADGFAVLQAARQANSSAYVVIVTGYASLDSAIRAVRVGAYDYLTKPFSLSQLEVILERIHDRIKLQETNRRLQPGRGVADYPERAAGITPQLEQRLATIEASLTRIEQLLIRAK